MTENEMKALGAVETIYAWVDRELATDAACAACGRCCHFKSYGHRLYASYLEALYLVDRQGMPTGSFDDDHCGYQGAAACSAREGRVLGCRTFFCSRDTRKNREIHSRALDAIRRVTAEFALSWDYRPLAEHLSRNMAATASSA